MNIICTNWVISFMELKAPNHKISNNLKKKLNKEYYFQKHNSFQMLHVSFHSRLLLYHFIS